VLESFRRAGFVTLGIAALSSGCAGGNARDEPARWNRQQAESITVVRGMPVRVRHCRGVGRAREEHDRLAYRRFRCLAGARSRFDPYGIDTVAVVYVLYPLAPYDDPSSSHRLSDVRFVGGPGIP
jgi:hypothetical protein